jgi:molybdenum cofactor cytidylyltransferase
MLACVVEALRGAPLGGLVVVLRPGDAEGARAAAELGAPRVFAESAEEGRAASVRAGIRASPPEASGWLFALADQPLLRAEDFAALVAEFAETPGRIVAARYGKELGSPVLFGRDFRGELLALRGSEGGRVVLRSHREALLEVALSPERGRDADSPEDLRALAAARARPET